MGRALVCVLFILLAALVDGKRPVFAVEGNPEQALRSSVDQARRILLASPGSHSFADKVSALQGAYEAISASHLLISERMRLRGDVLQSGDALGSARHLDAAERYALAISRVLAGFERMAALAQTDASTLEDLRSALADLASPRWPAIHGTLPYSTPSFPKQPPLSAPQIVPAYRMSQVVPATPADYFSTPEAQNSALISNQAKAIAAAAGRSHWDPAAIYNWVRENVRTEWYWGSMKGAEETLRQRSGNDADQAALLIALLRASGYPARYVRGVAEFFPGLGAARSATGINEPEQILAYFQAAGIPCEEIREGSVVTNLRFEHIWVEALVPYTNYRGMETDATGKLWVPLDTSLKSGGFDETSIIDLMSLPGNPLAGYRDRYLAAVREPSPLEMLRGETELFLSANQPGSSYADVLHTRVQRSAPLSILPATLQFVDSVVTAEYAALPLELQHQVRLRATVDDPGAESLFDLTVSLRELSNRQSMISFEPETIQDQEQINRWGGLDNTPAYLVRLRPTVVVAGERLAVAANGLTFGGEFRLTIDFSAPAGSLSVSDRVICGYPLLLGIVAQEALPPALEATPLAAPELLHRAALSYIESWNQGESELASLFNLALTRPLPTFVAVGGQLRVDELAGIPHTVDWQGLYIDANLRTAAVIPRVAADDGRVRSFFEISALEGSVQEHRLFEKEFKVESISTAKLIGLSQVSGSQLLTLDAANMAELLPALDLDEPVKADIADAVALGQVVRIPAANVNYSAWSGIGYLKENPLTGEAGYMLSGGLAGGQTVLGRLNWPAEMAAIMARPFTGPPNEDIARAFSLTAMTPPEVMLATAGEELDGTLMVLVRDESRVPVAGAPVTFRVRTGGGWLIDDLGVPGEKLQELTVLSGRDGIVRARFTPGQSTFVNPVAYLRDGDHYGNIVGENLVDAQLASGSLAKLPTPLAVFGFAGLPDLMKSKAYGNDLTGEVFSYSGDLWLLLADRFGNPVANHAVTFTARPVEPAADSACQNPSGLTAAQRNAQLVADDVCLQRMPIHGECAGAASLSVASRSDGSSLVGVILGGVPHAGYPVTAKVVTNAGLAGTSWTHYSAAFASCLGNAAPENRLVLHYQERLDATGHNVDARPAGQPAEILAKSWLLAEDAELLANGQKLSCGTSTEKTCDMIAGTGAFTIMTPSQVIINGKPAVRAATMTDSTALPWLYRSNVTLPVGLATVSLEAAAVRTMDRIDNRCAECGETERNVSVAIGPVYGTTQIWGVDITVPDVVTVQINPQGISQSGLTFGFAIQPAQYVASFAQVLLYRDGELWDTLPASKSGTSSVVFPAGYFFDPTATYELQVLLNNEDDANEILSRKVPLLQRTAAVELLIDGLPSTVKSKAGAFVLLNNDFDEKDANPEVTLPDAATPAIVATDDELKRAWLLIDDSSGMGGHWQVRASDPTRLRIYHQRGGEWFEFKPDNPPEPLSGFPTVIPLLLEGLTESASIKGDKIVAAFTPLGGVEVRDELPLTTLDLDLAVDGNRDRTIDFRGSLDEQALFWVNNDHDVLGTEDGQPVEDDAEAGDDSADARISCKRDLEDFSRLHVWLGAADASRVLTYTLEMDADDEMVQPMLNVFPAINVSDGYLGLPSENATEDQPDKQLLTGLLAAVSKRPAKLSSDKLEANKNNYFLFEGRRPGKGKLVLTASYQGVPVASRNVALELVDPVWFYDHFVLSQTSSSDDSPVKPEVNPEGMGAGASRVSSWQPTNNEYVLFVHGWNMQPWEKMRWTETMFKRLWWQGYQGKVGVFDWPCRTLPSWDFLVNFDRSELVAWQSADALKDVLYKLQGEHAGQVRLLAHSQGNVVAGEALQSGEPGLVHTYVASQAALAAGFFDQAFPQLPGMTLKTPNVMSSYPDDPAALPYLSGIARKVARWFNYYNVRDYALTGDSLDQPTWLLNNRTRPDGSLGYGYQGNTSSYPPVEPNIGFFRSVVSVGSEVGEYELLPLEFPDKRHEIFSFCAQSWTSALGAASTPSSIMEDSIDLSPFGYDRDKSSHSRQFRSNVVDEQKYWQRFVQDAALFQ